MTRRRIDTYHHNESRYANGAKTGENVFLCCQLRAAKKELMIAAQRGLIFTFQWLFRNAVTISFAPILIFAAPSCV